MTKKQGPNPPTKLDLDAGEYLPIPGTEDWYLVAETDAGGYSWTTWRAYYSPSARRYFWHGDSGCSCSGWADNLHTSSRFESGSREDAARGLHRFAEVYGGYGLSPAHALGADTKIRTFKEPKP